jgi:CubicO group peptidase (beta-lactamase class C family)
MVGGAVWFFHEGRPLAKVLHGLADIGENRSVDEDTIFHWGSVTKTLTGIAILQLRDRGLLALDDPVVKYLPELRKVHNPYGDTETITIRHVMTHSAGFAPEPGPGERENPGSHSSLPSGSSSSRCFPTPRSSSSPEAVSATRIPRSSSRAHHRDPRREDYEVYVDKNIFKPLGMHGAILTGRRTTCFPFRSNNYTVRDGVPGERSRLIRDHSLQQRPQLPI